MVAVDLEDLWLLTCLLLRNAGRSRRGETTCELPSEDAARDEGNGTFCACGVPSGTIVEPFEFGRSLVELPDM
jgi:hypothetical protein